MKVHLATGGVLMGNIRRHTW